MAAAAELFGEGGLEAASLNAIARRAALAKSNLYRYFETKEGMFLELLLDDVGDWVVAVEYSLGAKVGSGDPAVVARGLVATLAERPRLAALLAELPRTLERNVSEHELAAFRHSLRIELARVQEAVHAAIPEVSPGESERLVRQMLALVAGLWPVARPSTAAARASEPPDSAVTGIDFEQELETALRTLLRGFVSQG
jgi:AcrR family transcriptional regulator